MRFQKTILASAMLCVMASMAHAQTLDEMYEARKKEYVDKRKSNGMALPQAGMPSGSGGPMMGVTPLGAVAAPSQNGIKPVSAVSDKDMRLTGLFGVGDDIEAHVTQFGSTHTIKQGMTIDGWRFTLMGDRWIELTKPRGKGKNAKVVTKRLHISTIPRNYEAKGSGAAALPPVMPGQIPYPFPTATR